MFFLFLGQENESCSVFSLLRDRYALQEYELVGNLQHDAGAVASLVVCTFCSTVAHVLQYLQGRIHQFVGFVSVDIDYHAYSACIMFV